MTPARVEPFAHRALDGTPYVLTGVVGEGGMGYVFEAEHAELKRRAAIKVLGVRMAHNDRAMDRLRREARVLASLANPHIVDVYDMGFTADGQPYIAMSFVDGQDLAKNLAIDGPFTPTRVVGIVEQVADALMAVHAQGMVHRDLKPENIMLEPRDGAEHVVLLDFGIAWVLDADTQITRDGQVMGTPGYISPEQALGMPVDGRADQYRLAAVVYRLLTGQAAYGGTSGLELMTAQLTSDPRPFDVDDAVPPAMRTVVMRALSRDPDDRFPDLQAFAVALRASLTAPVPVAATQKALPFVLAAGLALATAALLLWAPWQTDASTAGPAPRASNTQTKADQAKTAQTAVANAQSAEAHAETATGNMAGSRTPPVSHPTTPRLEAARPPSASPKTVEPATPVTQPAAPITATAMQVAKPNRVKPARVGPATPRPKRLVRTAPPPSKIAPRPQSASTTAEPKAPVSVAQAPASAEALAPSTAAAVPAARPAVIASNLDALTARAPQKPVQTRLVIDAPQVRGAVSDRPIRKALATSHAALRACVDRLPAPVTGAASIRLSIDADGFLSSVRGDGSPALVRCGVAAVKRVRRLRRRPDTGNIQVQLPIRMVPK